MAKTKDPAAVALGRKGGLVRGVAKGFGYSELTPEERKANAEKAAAARWGTKKKAAKKKAQ